MNSIKKEPLIMIIGAMKCGTSSLFDYLSCHHKICPSTPKEPEFFSENQGHQVEVDSYDDLFSFDSSIHAYAMEASTGYTKFPSEKGVPKRIADYGLRPKFIYIVRNPFERIESHYHFMKGDPQWTLPITGDHLINASKYFLQLEHYSKVFSHEDICIIDFSDLIHNPGAVIERVYGFLDLAFSDKDLPGDFGVKNAAPKRTRFDGFLEKSLFRHFYRLVPGRLKQRIARVLYKVAPDEKRRLTDDEKAEILLELEDDMLNLNRHYNIDVAQWGFDTPTES